MIFEQFVTEETKRTRFQNRAGPLALFSRRRVFTENFQSQVTTQKQSELGKMEIIRKESNRKSDSRYDLKRIQLLGKIRGKSFTISPPKVMRKT